MTVALIVGLSSLALLAYWFRYTSLLILSTKTSQNYSFDIARANELHFPEIRAAIGTVSPERFDGLMSGLDHDYRLISAMLRNVEPQANRDTLEDVILQMDFAGLRVAYWFSQRVSEETTRKILAEMSEVVTHFANAVGERSMASCAESTAGA